MPNMNCAYLVLVYKNFPQVTRLVRRLLLSSVGIVIHVDERVEIPADFLSDLPASDRARVILTAKRWVTDWGAFEMVTASLHLLQEGLKHFPSAGHLVLMTGQDYPIKSPEQIRAFFAENDCSILEHRPLLDETWKYGGVKRINRFYWARNRKSLPGFFFRTIPLPPRRFPLPKDKLYVGSEWCALKREDAGRMLEFAEKRPDVVRAFRWTYIPNEMFLATVLVGYLGETKVRNERVHFAEGFSLPRDYLRLKIIGRNGIKILNASDLAKLRASTALFARKFDTDVDSKILDLLDETTAASTSPPF